MIGTTCMNTAENKFMSYKTFFFLLDICGIIMIVIPEVEQLLLAGQCR